MWHPVGGSAPQSHLAPRRWLDYFARAFSRGGEGGGFGGGDGGGFGGGEGGGVGATAEASEAEAVLRCLASWAACGVGYGRLCAAHGRLVGWGYG